MNHKIYYIIAGLLFAFVLIAGCNDDDNFWNGTDDYIVSFQIEVSTGTSYSTIISSDSIILKIPGNVSLNGASASVDISENSTISPEPSTIADWETSHKFTVTSHSGNEKIYHYSVVYEDVASDGDIVLSTQDEVDSFATLGINEIRGNLTIGAEEGTDSITSLAALSGLKKITSDLVINTTYAGTDLNGFENLEQVGSIEIESTPFLGEVSFPALKSVMNDLTVYISKVNLLNFPALENVDNSITIERNDSIETLNFSSLKTVGTDFIIKGLANNNKLKSISLPTLESVQGELLFYYLYNLESISIPEITVAGSVSFYGNTILESISLPNLVEVFKDVKIYSLSALTTLDFSSLLSVTGDLYLQNLTSVENLEGLKSLTSVGGTFTLRNFPLVTDLSPLSKFTGAKEVELGVGIGSYNKLESFTNVESLTISGDGSEVEIIDVSNISNLSYLKIDGISDLFTLKGPDVLNGSLRIQTSDFQIEGFKEVENLELYDFPTFGNITDKEVGVQKVNGYCAINVNINSVNLVGTLNFPNLESVGGKLTIYSRAPVTMPVLKESGEILSKVFSTDGLTLTLPSLERVNGDFQIMSSYSNNQLADIDLPSLTTVEGRLTISGNSSYQPNNDITNLNGISTLTNLGSLTVRYNSLLTDYSGLANAVPSLTSNTCTILGNAYNPTYQDLVDRKFATRE